MNTHIIRCCLVFSCLIGTGTAIAETVTEYVADYGFGYTGYGATSDQACINLVAELNNSIDFEGITFESVIESANDVARPCGDDYLYVIYPACRMGNGEAVNSPAYCTAYASVRTRTKQTETYQIELKPLIGSPVSDQLLAETEPETGDNVVPVVAVVTNQNNEIVPNIDILLEPHVVAYSGGHEHDDLSRNTNYSGELTGHPSNGNSVIGNTGEDGYIFTFTAPSPAGDHLVLASCIDIECSQVGPSGIWVGFKGLRSLEPLVDNEGEPLYELIGATETHPDNHYLTPINAYKAVIIANLYKHSDPDAPILRYNDASMERGGRFDVIPSDYPWQNPHITHRDGEDLDVRANPVFNPGTAIPSENFEAFRRIVKIVGGYADIHSDGTSNQHFHINF